MVINNCYNAGKVSGVYNASGFCGITYANHCEIKNSYNIGKIENGSHIDSIIYSEIEDGVEEHIIENVYYLDSSCNIGTKGESKNEEELKKVILEKFSKDIWTKDVQKNNEWQYNKGYPIFKWQLEN